MSPAKTAQCTFKQDRERSVEAESAIATGLHDIRELNLRHRTFTIGQTFPIYETRLYDQQGVLLARGTGKGVHPFNYAGAVFEAIEHLVGVSMPPESNQLIPKSSTFLASQSVTEQYIPFQILQDFPVQQINCTEFQQYDNPNEKLYLPAFLWSPHLCSSPDYYLCKDNLDLCSVLLKYACNSGVATGLTPDDAILHGINEGIERDGHGRLLYKYFFNEPQENNPLPILDHKTFPQDLQDEIADIETKLKDKCIIINATSDLGIPVIGAVFKKYHTKHIIPAPGFGCSLFPDFAIRRAIYEAMQIMQGADYYPEARKKSFEEDLRRAQSDDRYTRCVKFDISPYEKTIGYKKQAYDQFASPCCENEVCDVTQQIEFLIRHLQTHKLKVYTHTIKQLKHNTYVISTQIPGLSLFYLTSNGMMIPPTGRTVN